MPSQPVRTTDSASQHAVSRTREREVKERKCDETSPLLAQRLTYPPPKTSSDRFEALRVEDGLQHVDCSFDCAPPFLNRHLTQPQLGFGTVGSQSGLKAPQVCIALVAGPTLNEVAWHEKNANRKWVARGWTHEEAFLIHKYGPNPNPNLEVWTYSAA